MPKNGVPAVAMARSSSSVRFIQGRPSVTLLDEPVMMNAEASFGPGSGASVRTSCSAHAPAHVGPTSRWIHER